MSKKEMQKVDENTAVAVAFEGMDGLGKENLDESVLPMLHLCQALSPEVDEGVAKAGDMVIRPIGATVDAGFRFVVLTTWHGYILWKEEGGIEWKHRCGDVPEDKQHLCEWEDGEDDDNIPPVATETRTALLCMVDDAGMPVEGRQFVASWSRASTKIGRNFFSTVQAAPHASFSAIFEMAVDKVTGGKGNYHVLHPKLVGSIGSVESAQALKEMHAQLAKSLS